MVLKGGGVGREREGGGGSGGGGRGTEGREGEREMEGCSVVRVMLWWEAC